MRYSKQFVNKNTKSFAAGLSTAEMREARSFESAGLTSISQAVKAFERGETERIREWRKQLAAKNAVQEMHEEIDEIAAEQNLDGEVL